MDLKISTEPDSRPLKEILDEIHEIARQLSYADWSLIHEDLCEILRRYGEEDKRAEKEGKHE